MHEQRDGTDEPSGEAPTRTRRDSWLRSLSLSRVPFATIFATVGTVVVVYLLGTVLYRLRDLVLIMVVGGFIALLVDPLVLALQRLGIRRRGVGVAIVSLATILAFGGLAFAFGSPLVRGLTHFANDLPNYVTRAEHGKGWIGHLVQRYHVETWVQRNSPKLISFAESLSKPILSLGKGAFSAIASLLGLFVFVLLLLLEAPKMRVSLLAALPPATAARFRRLGTEIARSVSGYMLGNLTTSLIAGVVVFVTLTVLSVPFALLWALWVALVDFLPEVGGALALIPTVLFAFTHSLVAGIVSAVVFLVYWQLENRILNPVAMSRTVRINPLLVFVSVIVGAGIGNWVGGTFGGFAAALIAIPGAGAGQAIVRDLRRAAGEPLAPSEPSATPEL